MKLKTVILLGLVGFVAFLSGGWLLQRGSAEAGSVYQRARMFDNVVHYVADFYVDSVGEAEIYDMAIDGLLRELGDPYSFFLRPSDLEDMQVQTTGNYGGIGVRIEITDGWITVVVPLPETPAERAGFQSGDRIIRVEGRSTENWTVDQAVNSLRGEPNSEVSIEVLRAGMAQPIPFTIRRERIHVRSVQYGNVLPGGIGYVQLATVSEQSARELAEEVTRLRSAGARALVLDLRNNPGGLLDQGIEVSDLFLDRGQVVVETRGRAPDATATYRARSPQRWPDLPMIVLVNGFSASASEIIAGALQDHDRALVLGTLTFGKGLVQSLYRMGPTEALRLTTANWYTPSGRQLERPRRDDAVTTVAATRGPQAAPPVARDSLPTFRTTGGRIVLGGGGIHPDREVRLDTLSSAEQAFARALGPQIPVYRDVMSTYALDVKAANRVTDPDFEVTPRMRAEFLQRLRARDLPITDELWAAARPLIDRQLGDEITRYVFGRPAEVRRQIVNDAQVLAAVDMLTRARTAQQLFELAQARTSGGQ
ncbi:MAG: S41 family peptidase [Gemmatimonadales bacterium]